MDKLKEQFKSEFGTINYRGALTQDAIADWWLSKMLERERELWLQIEAMKAQCQCMTTGEKHAISCPCQSPSKNKWKIQAFSKAQSLLALDESSSTTNNTI